MRIKTLLKKLLLCILLIGVVFAIITYSTSSNNKFRGHNNEFVVPLQDSLRNFRWMYSRNETAPLTNGGRQGRRKWSGYGFLKVHKAASSTTQGLFLRYGWRNNLTFIIPPEYNAFRYPNIISINESVTSYNTLPPPPGKSFDILCHHVIYNKKAWSKFLPNNSAIIGTVREPFSLFKSIVNYFNPPFLRRIRSSNPIRTFLLNPQDYAYHGHYSFLNNRMAVEFGVDLNTIITRNFDKFEKYLYDVLDKEFTIVLLAERFEESVVLMRRKLNWNLMDILYLSVNISPDYIKTKYTISEDDRELHKHFAIFDYLLYNFFSKKLDDQIAGEVRFSEEVAHFGQVRKSLRDYCRHGDRLWDSNLAIQESEWSEPVTITRADCYLLSVYEIHFTQNIRKRQYGYATWEHRNPPPKLRKPK